MKPPLTDSCLRLLFGLVAVQCVLDMELKDNYFLELEQSGHFYLDILWKISPSLP